MTAISAQVAEKPANKAEEGVCKDKKTRRWITAVLLCLLFLFITAACGVGIMIVLNRYPQQTPIDYDVECPTQVPSEWIFWTRVAGRVDLHESALINHDDRTALMVSSEAFKINATNSLALHDYTMGYVALRDFNMCLVSKVSDANFEHVQETLRERQGKRLPLQSERRVFLRSHQMTSSELGTRLSEFCQGVPAHWFEDAPGHVWHRERRDTGIKLPGDLLCFSSRILVLREE